MEPSSTPTNQRHGPSDFLSLPYHGCIITTAKANASTTIGQSTGEEKIAQLLQLESHPKRLEARMFQHTSKRSGKYSAGQAFCNSIVNNQLSRRVRDPVQKPKLEWSVFIIDSKYVLVLSSRLRPIYSGEEQFKEEQNVN